MASYCCWLLLLLLLPGTTPLAGENPFLRGLPPTDEPTPPPPESGMLEEDLIKSYGELKSMYYALKAKLDKKMFLVNEEKQRPRIHGSNNVAMSPIFLDLDNIDNFNDISSLDTPTAATTVPTVPTTTTAATTGPVILGEDPLGRQILRFVDQWEEEFGTSPATQVTEPVTTATSTTDAISTTTAAPAPTTTAEQKTTTEETNLLEDAFLPPLLQHVRDETPVVAFPFFTKEPFVVGPQPLVPIFVTTPSPPTGVVTDGDSLVHGPPPPLPAVTPAPNDDFQTTSFFSRATESPVFAEETFPSFITEVTFPPQQEEGESQDLIWWTPRPAFLNMSSILLAPPPVRQRNDPPMPLWHPRRRPSTIQPPPPPRPTLPPPASSTLNILPEIEPKVRKVAEQTVVNDLELAAGGLNMPELVKELRNEQTIPPVLNVMRMDRILEMKRKTLEQLEILEQLANRKNELQELIDKQKRMLIVRAREVRVTDRVEETTTMASRIVSNETPPSQKIEKETSHVPTTISAIPQEALWPRRRGLSKRKRQRMRHIRKPKMVDEEVPSVDELTQLLEAELQEAQRDAKSRELRELCSQTMCSFERGDFCKFETSYDEVTRRQRDWRRNTRSVETAPIYTIRAWSNWVGSFSPNGTTVDRAPHFNSENRRFAGVFLEPQQLASLTLTISYADTFTVRFRAWETTKGMRLRVCCDDFCPFSTDLGRSRRKWRQLRATCPAETRQLAFECEMLGSRRKGVCAVDSVFIEADECPALLT